MRVPAAMRQRLPMTAWFMMIAPIPTSVPSPMLQPCSMAWWPTETFLPRVSGMPGSACRTEASWDVGALADADDVAVAAENGVEPYARLVVQNHRADDGGVLRDEPLLAVEYHFALAEGKDRHDCGQIISERPCYHHALP